MIVYKTTNLINGKIYIGKDSKNDPTYLGSGVLIKRALRKYGKTNFNKEVLFESNDEDEINRMEIFFIKKYSSTHEIYNLGTGGEGGWNLRYASKERISIFKERVGFKSKSSWSDPNSVFNSKEYRKKLSAAGRRRTVTDKTKEKLRLANIGKHIPHDQRIKISMTVKELWEDPESIFNSNEYRDKLSAAATGRPCTEETKQKISKANSGSKNGRSVKIKIDGKIYDTRRQAAAAFSISETAVRKRCLSKNFPTWEYC